MQTESRNTFEIRRADLCKPLFIMFQRYDAELDHGIRIVSFDNGHKQQFELVATDCRGRETDHGSGGKKTGLFRIYRLLVMRGFQFRRMLDEICGRGDYEKKIELDPERKQERCRLAPGYAGSVNEALETVSSLKDILNWG
jgi:hypothetical protein